MGIIADTLATLLADLQESDRRSQQLVADTIKRCDDLLLELEAIDDE